MEDNNLTPLETNDSERIHPVNIEEQMKTAYIDYSMSVIVGRALPDVRDGFKPVHRRVLHAMNELGIHYNKPYKKSAMRSSLASVYRIAAGPSPSWLPKFPCPSISV